jgi:hypothetical protein
MKDEQQNTPNFEEPEITGDSTVTEGFDDPNAKG